MYHVCLEDALSAAFSKPNPRVARDSCALAFVLEYGRLFNIVEPFCARYAVDAYHCSAIAAQITFTFTVLPATQPLKGTNEEMTQVFILASDRSSDVLSRICIAHHKEHEVEGNKAPSESDVQ